MDDLDFGWFMYPYENPDDESLFEPEDPTDKTRLYPFEKWWKEFNNQPSNVPTFKRSND